MLAVFKREFKSYFITPIGYIYLATFYFFLGFFFVNLCYAQGDPNVQNVVMTMQVIILFMIPILTMRLMSEDRRQKVDQALLTAPVRLSSIVIGKFLAAFVVYVIGYAPTIFFELITADHIPTLNFFPFFYSLFGMFLLGGVLIALGIFISSLTESQVIAAILGIVTNILILFITTIASSTNIQFLIDIAEKLAFISASESFTKQIISFSDILYFITLTVIFLFLSTRSLQKRRWS